MFDDPWFFIAALVIGVLVGWAIGSARGRPQLGALLGLLGLIGWLIVFFLPRRSDPDFSVAAHLDDATQRPEDLPAGTMPPHPDGSHHERPD